MSLVALDLQGRLVVMAGGGAVSARRARAYADDGADVLVVAPELCADLTTFVEGRKLEDDGNVLLRFNNGAKGVLHASQIANGEENDFNIRIYGEFGGLQWWQMEPNTLIYKTNEEGARRIRTGSRPGPRDALRYAALLHGGG